MATKQKQPAPPKRLNRTVGLGDALKGVIDPALRKRGFASRDLLTHWRAMAPPPYDEVTLPDRLRWPRGERGAGGATLYLRCSPGHALALNHEGALITQAINRYFGYVLISDVRLSIEAFKPATPVAASEPELDGSAEAAVAHSVAQVGDEGVRAALATLGRALARRRRS